jgi:hypothetical protein
MNTKQRRAHRDAPDVLSIRRITAAPNPPYIAKKARVDFDQNAKVE